MRPLWLALILVGFAFHSHAETISTGSRQFQAESSSVTLARHASEQAEAIRKRLYNLTGQRDHFISEIRIVFVDSSLGDDLDDYTYCVEAEPAVGRWSCSIRAEKEDSGMARPLPWPDAVVTALQYEMANRVRGKKGGGLVTWPAWFLWGMVGASDDQTHERMDELWTGKYRRKTYRTLDQIWKTPHGVSEEEKERIQVLSTWLIQELRRLPDGPAKLAKLTYEVNRGGFSGEVFEKIYRADFDSPRAADRWWTSRLAFFTHGSELASMDFDDTTTLLRDAMEGGMPEPGVQGLDKKGHDELNDMLKDLYRLMVAGHPMVRPAVETAISALESVRVNDMRRARAAWDKTRTILNALRPWHGSVNAALDRFEFSTDQETTESWLSKKGITE